MVELQSPERIGFLGLGIMGSRMAANVAKAGFPLTVWTHTAGKAERWAQEHGAIAAATPAEVASASEIVVSMVVDGGQVESVLCGAGGVADGAREGLLCVDMSTIAPTDTHRIASRLGQRGIRMADAPVTGSSPRAQAGTLTIMVGGEQQDFERAKPLLEAMGELIVHVGELGQGEMLKLKNLLLEHPGRVPVKLTIQLPGRKVSIAAEETFKIDFGPDLLASIEGLLGRGSVLEKFNAIGG